ncbi:hypothetical protein S101441_00745 [Bacillus subtilis subsp. subtilis]|nr:hypothetical protein S101441_00745 [Bacillus subtilis subsp. subtilis]POD82805.1 hypothetical protein S101384_04310 [Bacillus subtilis subsp. subtilis]
MQVFNSLLGKVTQKYETDLITTYSSIILCTFSNVLVSFKHEIIILLTDLNFVHNFSIINLVDIFYTFAVFSRLYPSVEINICRIIVNYSGVDFPINFLHLTLLGWIVLNNLTLKMLNPHQLGV